MSAAIALPVHPIQDFKKDTSKKKEKSKSKDKLEKKEKRDKKSSKKRRHEDLTGDGTQEDVIHIQDSSPTKRQRIDTSAPPISDVLVPNSQVPQLADLESPFLSITASIRVAIPPISQSYPLEGVCANYLSPLLLTYHLKLGGIVMGYNNVKLASSPPQSSRKFGKEEEEDPVPLAQAFDEYAAPYIWVTAQFLLLRLRKGITMEANVNLQNESHIGLILWNVFSVTIEKKRLPSGWKWIETTDGDTEMINGNADEDDQPMKRPSEVWGHWENEKGEIVEGMLRFTVKDFDVTLPNKDGEQSSLMVEGSLLDEEQERRLEKEDEEAAAKEKERLSGSRNSSRAGTPRR
ncbi:putative rna polymerase rpb7-like domain-containing protein [Venturia nashicola]|uniref:DNA-directed RNA polymerase subunit n=1 Tax=Venturia nashicola TaxID=86259 RepID=A0A4Z1PFA6_9PEZI|nr:putative rna polymerase rpb7-like domain-containing protein [Venturia nashicola]TLD38287.1 putative rna polymerase rpb7-like domain-containing protein [Venturia nashicola]